MFEDGDDILDAVGVLIAVLLVVGVGVAVLAATTASERANQAPDAEFDFRTVDDGTVQIAHVSGEPVPSDELVVTVDGLQRQVVWGDTITEGDAVTVEATEGSTVRLFWDPGEGERELIAEFQP
jgi:hypothetical protein